MTSNVQNQTNRRDPETGLTAVQVLEQATNYRYGSRALNVGNTGSYIYIPAVAAPGQLRAVPCDRRRTGSRAGFELR